MKNELCILVGLGCLAAYYYHSRPVPVAAKPTTPEVVVAAPAPTPRTYYHSPLDAPAMGAVSYTGMGYYSPVRGGFEVSSSVGFASRGPVVATAAGVPAVTSVTGSDSDPNAATGVRTNTGYSSLAPSHTGQPTASGKLNSTTASLRSIGALAAE